MNCLAFRRRHGAALANLERVGRCGRIVGPSANVFWRKARDPFFDGFAAVGNDHDRGALHQRNRDLKLLAGSGRVVDQLRGLLRAPEIIVGTWRAAKSMGDISEAEVREALQRLDPLWDELFPAEQARIVQLLVDRVDVSPDGADIRLRTEGLTNLVADLRAVRPEARRAA